MTGDSGVREIVKEESFVSEEAFYLSVGSVGIVVGTDGFVDVIEAVLFVSVKGSNNGTLDSTGFNDGGRRDPGTCPHSLPGHGGVTGFITMDEHGDKATGITMNSHKGGGFFDMADRG